MKLTRRVALGLLFSAALAGCSSGATEPALGTVRGVIKDNIGNTLRNVSLRLERSGRTPKTATTTSDGVFTFARLEAGSWMLAITPPSDYTVPVTQTNPLPITVRASRETDVTVTLARKTTPPPGGTGPVVSGSR